MPKKVKINCRQNFVVLYFDLHVQFIIQYKLTGKLKCAAYHEVRLLSIKLLHLGSGASRKWESTEGWDLGT